MRASGGPRHVPDVPFRAHRSRTQNVGPRTAGKRAERRLGERSRVCPCAGGWVLVSSAFGVVEGVEDVGDRGGGSPQVVFGGLVVAFVVPAPGWFPVVVEDGAEVSS
jgi:hypothetical protein